LITPHGEIARLFPEKAVLLDWHIPSIQHKPAPGNGVLFPASALGRKGAYQMREAAKSLNPQITVTGRELEAQSVWQGVAVKPTGQNWLDEVGLVVLPAYIEDRPKKLLEAVAAGIPVVACEAWGLDRVEGVTTLPAIEPRLLAEAIRQTINH
jgi:glycosyltransferase involved in cell wall biosynthesis